ncbi:hypothetical protein [Bifidobacterium catulorum]|uniref:hypothetical protein n=1 Tax=Bifidobacterium catulorum TaxID=1630173 RepID=UPI001F4D8DC3|nr:hypothetical protein [Bifidobacterium catulorum]
MSSAVSTPTKGGDPSLAKRTMGDLVKAAVSGWLGTALEFMDFQLYSLAAALVFKDIFFGHGSQAVAIMSAMAVYGVGYIARPIGAWYFGRLRRPYRPYPRAVHHHRHHGCRHHADRCAAHV